MSTSRVKRAKTGLLKTRCEPELQAWYEGLAYVRNVDVADVLRFALQDFKDRSSASAHFTLDYDKMHK